MKSGTRTSQKKNITSVGNVPVSLLRVNVAVLSAVICAISVGRLPVNLFSFIGRDLTTPLLHTTLSQA